MTAYSVQKTIEIINLTCHTPYNYGGDSVSVYINGELVLEGGNLYMRSKQSRKFNKLLITVSTTARVELRISNGRILGPLYFRNSSSTLQFRKDRANYSLRYNCK